MSEELTACALRVMLLERWGMIECSEHPRALQDMLLCVHERATELFAFEMQEIADGSLPVISFVPRHYRHRAVIVQIEAGSTAFELEALLGWESAGQIDKRYRKYFDRVENRHAFDDVSGRLSALLRSTSLKNRNDLGLLGGPQNPLDPEASG